MSSLFGRRLVLVVALLHRSVLPQVVKRLQLPGHVLATSNQGLYLLGVLHRLVPGKRRSQTVAEVVTTFGVLPAEVEELQGGRGCVSKNMSLFLLKGKKAADV